MANINAAAVAEETVTVAEALMNVRALPCIFYVFILHIMSYLNQRNLKRQFWALRVRKIRIFHCVLLKKPTGFFKGSQDFVFPVLPFCLNFLILRDFNFTPFAQIRNLCYLPSKYMSLRRLLPLKWR